MNKIFLTAVLLSLTSSAALAQTKGVAKFGTDNGSRLAVRSPATDSPVNVWPVSATTTTTKTQAQDFHYQGSLECSNCHVAAQAKNILNEVENFVELNEYKIWLRDDPHSRAYLSIIPDKDHFETVSQSLGELIAAVSRAGGETIPQPVWGEANDRSQAMFEKLFKNEYKNSGRILREVEKRAVNNETVWPTNATKMETTILQCLTCHAGIDKSKTQFDHESLHYGTGVGCESCHGPSSEWVKTHTNPIWRAEKPAEKESKYGLVNTRNPITRSQLCLSCHIGNAEQGRVVTHEMYAAGHPPLPSIEVETFAGQDWKHWRNLSEKSEPFAKDSDFKNQFAADLGLATVDTFPKTKNLLVSGMMASAQSANLLTELASAEGGQAWPEFAVFDCAACHHDLRAKGWKKGFAGVPGRPPATYWPKTLTKLSLAYLTLNNQAEFGNNFEKMQRDLQDALNQQPFGNPQQLSNLGANNTNQLEAARKLQAMPIHRDEAVKVLKLLCGMEQDFQPTEEVWDFHSARQLGWAINVVYTEIKPGNVDVDFESALRNLKEGLLLELPKTGEITDQQTQILATWREFDRDEFIEKLKALGAAAEKSEF